MTARVKLQTGLSGWLAVFCLLAAQSNAAADTPVTQDQILLLQQQNEQLQKQLQKQQELIDALTRKVSEMQDARSLKDNGASNLTVETQNESESPRSVIQPVHIGRVDISGEGGLAMFQSQANGQTPQSTFRVDEARLFFDAPVWQEVYFYSEIDLATREQNNLNLQVGQLYLDFENVSQLWGRDRMLNVRAGRFYIPFGEEYLNRFAIDNPLISHSVSDLWGSDNGVELYGNLGDVSYVVAVQNGGIPTTQDFTSDKSVTGRIGYDPANWLHLSVSGMRTGDLSPNGDMLSALWFGNGFIRSLGSPGTTHFHANLVEGDVQFRFPWLDLKGAGGYINYGDNDPLANNDRDVYYYYVEGDHNFTSKFYGATRFSEVLANNGFPIVGNGNFNDYLFNELTANYWTLSLGLGYRFSSNLLIKGEYSFNRGTEQDGTTRGHEDLFALEAAFKF